MIDPVARFVALFNEGVRTGDLAPWLNLFTDDAVLMFGGDLAPPANGRSEIAAIFRDRPPGSEMALTAGSPVDPDSAAADVVFGDFFWVRTPEHGGRFTLHLRGDLVETVDLDLDDLPPGAAYGAP